MTLSSTPSVGVTSVALCVAVRCLALRHAWSSCEAARRHRASFWRCCCWWARPWGKASLSTSCTSGIMVCPHSMFDA